MPKTYTENDIVELIRAEVAASSLTETAARLGVSISYVSDLVRGTRNVSERIAEELGFEREIQTKVSFRKKVQAA
jgi:plasmid maintenance system antidote protein VapI